MASLQTFLPNLNVPAGRRLDLAWLGRNLAIGNADHPDLVPALRLLQQAMQETGVSRPFIVKPPGVSLD
jgi:hypothetical protein